MQLQWRQRSERLSGQPQVVLVVVALWLLQCTYAATNGDNSC